MTAQSVAAAAVLTARRNPDNGLHELVGSRSPLTDRANEYLAKLAIRGLSPMTIRAYAFDLVTLLRWLSDVDKQFEELEEADLFDFIAEQQSREAKASSINRRLVVAQSFFRFVVGRPMRRGKGVCAPAPHYKGRGYDRVVGVHSLSRPRRVSLRVKMPNKLVNPLTIDEVRALVASFHRYRDLAIVYLMLLCGLRSNEVLTLKIDDINTVDKCIRVHGKGNRERLVPMPEVLDVILSRYLRLERPYGVGDNRLFVVLHTRRRGNPMTAAGLRSLFRHRRASPQLRNANPHRLRHTFGADMARAGVRLPVLKKMMGHADPRTTLRYINLSMDDIMKVYREALQKIDTRYAR